MSFSLRPAGPQDIDFLTDMLVEASDWQGVKSGGLPQQDRRVTVLADPKVAGYIDGWLRDGDAGVVAVDSEHRPIGASWTRLFTKDAPAFGFVSPEVPELAIGIVKSWRGKGIGRRLLREVVTMTGLAGYDRLSLSVDVDNPAKQLYASEGFEVIETRPTAVTMLKTL
ncbi:GNAT family N-acetyltransferase [Stackebrandtia nassauensis]|uniref:GCN5-related N-acetyltransferase n=1 Tax=Stackebrandtia nassauensis (strain DSM 44728 / CIP 108903 / NRRL B-16338 / NBRC 102104 / LLR-40K-21) TaxID=446470 RepID=D3Q0Y5_STANL|nr:GNAT family N-acetyltransferase [Stackebrandtia nassauensis]ADD43735.1 GCN5-related N-acetyltransferase [Stackebrandtia nassauensis DSM 44728]